MAGWDSETVPPFHMVGEVNLLVAQVKIEGVDWAAVQECPLFGEQLASAGRLRESWGHIQGLTFASHVSLDSLLYSKRYLGPEASNTLPPTRVGEIT